MHRDSAVGIDLWRKGGGEAGLEWLARKRGNVEHTFRRFLRESRGVSFEGSTSGINSSPSASSNDCLEFSKLASSSVER